MPDPRRLHVDSALSNFAVLLGQRGFIAERVMPIVPVEKESDVYFVHGVEHLSDDAPQLRKSGDTAGEVEYDLSTDTYRVKEYSLRRLVRDAEVDNADAPIRPYLSATRILKGKIWLGWEKRVKTALTTTGNFATVVAAGTVWTDVSSDPEKNIDDAKEGVETKSGFTPNYIVIPPHIARAAKRVTKIRDLVKATDPSLLVNGDLPPILFNLRVIIPGAIQNTANAAAAAAVSRVWNNTSVQVLYIEDNVSTESACWGKTFRHRKFGVAGERTKTYRDEGRDGTFTEYGIKQDEKVTSISCGAIITGASA